MIKVINNFLDNIELFELNKTISGSEFPWYQEYLKRSFIHDLIKDGEIKSKFVFVTQSFKNQLQAKEILNFQLRYFHETNKIFFLRPIKETEKDMNNLIFFLNTNNGITELTGGPKIESVENRAILFNSTMPYAHSSTTSASGRYVINMTYI